MRIHTGEDFWLIQDLNRELPHVTASFRYDKKKQTCFFHVDEVGGGFYLFPVPEQDVEWAITVLTQLTTEADILWEMFALFRRSHANPDI